MEKVMYIFKKPNLHIIIKEYNNMLDPFIEIMNNKEEFLYWIREDGMIRLTHRGL